MDSVEIPTIYDINLSLKHDSLLMVCGKIGSGKTTLLNSIMDETSKIGGDLEVKGNIAYVE
jgi:ABC-type lipoprotein export system ATPase subunit